MGNERLNAIVSFVLRREPASLPHFLSCVHFLISSRKNIADARHHASDPRATAQDWRSESTHAQESDFVFASARICGRKPRGGSMVVESHLRPAAERARVIEISDGKTYIDGEMVKRFGFHTFRHSLTSWLMANGENPQIVRAMLR
jgi:integrase